MAVDVLTGAGPPLWQSWLVVVHEGHLNDSAPTAGQAAFTDDTTPPFSLDLREWMGRKEQGRRAGRNSNGGGTGDENPLGSWQQTPKIWTWCVKAFVVVAACIPHPRNVTARHENGFRSFGIWLIKARANSSVSIYRNPDCLLVMV